MPNIRRIEFFDREKEKEEIMNILKVEPRSINFVYGPINSGKTTLITNLIENLPENYVVFYINLRGKLIKEYGGFVRVLFKIKRKEIFGNVKEKGEKIVKRAVVLAGRYLSGIPIEKDMLDGFIEKENTEDVFEFLEEYFLKISEERIPVLIVDELQVIGDLEIDGKLIYKLFNFFIRLTKELHLCHVFALSSDSLFIEKVYSEAMLQGRANYILVDDFDEETAKKFLDKYKFGKEEVEITYVHVGGKPGYLINLISAKETGKDVIAYAKEMIENRKNTFLFLFAENKEKNSDILEIFCNFKQMDEIKFGKDINLDTLKFLVKNNILFIDAVTMNIKPQSRIDLIAIREILKEIKNNRTYTNQE